MLVTLYLIGAVTVHVDGYEVKECQYKGKNSHHIVTLPTKPYIKCLRTIQVG